MFLWFRQVFRYLRQATRVSMVRTLSMQPVRLTEDRAYFWSFEGPPAYTGYT